MSALIAFVTHYNFPFYAIGGVTLLLMWLWPLGSDKEFGSGGATRGSEHGLRPMAAPRSVDNPARSYQTPGGPSEYPRAVSPFN